MVGARTDYLLCSLSGVAGAGGTWSMTGSRGRSLGEAEVRGSRSCGAFVRRNNESEGYGDPGGHRFVVCGLYRRCTALKMLFNMIVEVLKPSN